MQNPVRSGASSSLYLSIFYTYFAFALLFQAYPPLFNALMAEFDIGRQAVALVMTLFLAPIVVLAVPAGLLVDRLGVRRVGWVAFGLMAAGALVSGLTSSFPVLLAARALAGAGGSFLIVAVLKIITYRFTRERLGLALGIFAAGLPAGTAIAFNVLSAGSDALGWRAVTLVTGLIAISALWPYLWLASGAPVEEGRLQPPTSMASVFGSGELWRLTAVTMFGYAAIIGFTTWTPSILVEYAAIPLWVSLALASLLLVVDIPFAPLWGKASDRMGTRKAFVVLAFTVFLAGSLVVPYIARSAAAVPGLLLIIGIIGIGCAMFFPAALAIPAENVAPPLAGAAYGMLFTAQVAGMMVGPSLVGFILDSASIYAGFLTVSAMALAGLAAALTLRTR